MSADILPCRDYQETTISDLDRDWAAGYVRLAAVLATGLGKTHIFTHLAARWSALNPGKRVLILAHTDELVLQAYGKMRKVAPHLTVGIVKAERNETTAHIVIASVQSLRSVKRRNALRNVGLVICDEVHHCTASTYRAIFEHFGCMKEQGATPLAGFTATLARSDKSKISDVIEKVSSTYSIGFGIRRGYLLDVRGKRIEVPDMDLSKVRRQGGDYADGSLAAELDRALAPQIVAEKYRELAGDRKGLVFTPTVESAEHFATAFNDAGVPAAVVHGKLGREERRLVLKRLAAGDIRVVVNCAVLTEGFDDPTISCVVIARPTRSAPLYQQMVGRGLRPDLSLPPDGRGDCLVLDVVGASRSHDLRSLVDLSEKRIPEEALDQELSLLELEEYEERQEHAGENVVPPEEYVGETEAVDFDPLGRTTAGAWLVTFGGTYFLPIGRKAYVLIVPSESEPGRWDVGWLVKAPRQYGYLDCPARGYANRFGYGRWCRCGQQHEGAIGDLTEHRGLSLEMACSWAEEVMEKVAGKAIAHQVGGANQAWRSLPPNITILREAWELGIPTKGLNKGELTDAVEILSASRRIDPVIDFMKMTQAEDGEQEG